MPPRRHVLRTALPAVLASAAGCQEVVPANQGTRTPFDSPATTTPGPPERTATGPGPYPPGTTADLGDGAVGLRSLHVRQATTYQGQWMTHLAARDPSQYLSARVTPRDRREGDRGPRDRFRLLVDGDRYEPGIADRFSRDRLLFELPADLALNRGRFRWTGDDGTEVAWRVPDARLRKLRLSSSIVLERFDALEVRRTGDHVVAVEFLVRARNDGARDGQFVGLVQLPTGESVDDLNPSTAPSFPVARGDAATWHRTARWSWPNQDRSSLSLAWASGATATDVTVME